MDPYQVLEISRDATAEEIKKAYRQKAKQYHPDLHPDDPTCTQKMNEVNEAYDRLTHPEKYKDIHYGGYQNQSSSGGYGPYQNQSSGNSYGPYQNQNGGSSYGPYQNQGSGNGYRGYWQTGDGTGYFDLFGFGRANVRRPSPQVLNQDPRDIAEAVYYYNQGNYDQAAQILNQVVSSRRDARWHYLSAIVNYERNQKVMAMDQIRKAMQMVPGNQEYKNAYLYMNQTGQNYQTVTREYTDIFSSMGNICMWYMVAQCFCMFCH